MLIASVGMGVGLVCGFSINDGACVLLHILVSGFSLMRLTFGLCQ
jgi:hypothetical protein